MHAYMLKVELGALDMLSKALTLSYNPGPCFFGTQSHHVAEAGLEPTTLLPLPFNCCSDSIHYRVPL